MDCPGLSGQMKERTMSVLWGILLFVAGIITGAGAIILHDHEVSRAVRAVQVRKNAEIQKKQTMQNLSKLLDNMLAQHPQETLNVLALCCFVEPEHVDDYTIDEYFQCIMDMMQNKSVMNFFSLLAQIQTQQKSI